MNKNEIGLNAGKIWQLLSNNAKWDYGTLKKKSRLGGYVIIAGRKILNR